MGGDLTQGTVKGDAVACPVPRLALGRGRPVRCGALCPANPGGGPDPVLAHPGAERAAVRLARRLDAPYSCRQGICGACACQLTGGEVEMAHNEVLEAADISGGYILACQAVALTPKVSITY